MKKFFSSCFFLFLPLLLGGMVGFFIKDFIDFDLLHKPPLAPPGFLFPIVWSILYFLMGLSFFLYKKDYPLFSETDFYYYLQLFFNLIWPVLFFIFKMRFLSILFLFILLGLIVLFMKNVIKKKKISFYLFIPYLLWTCFAFYLNIGFFILN